MTEQTSYLAGTATIHPAFALFHETTRRACAERFIAAEEYGSRFTEIVVVVNGNDYPITCCPLGFCLIQEAVVTPVEIIVEPSTFDPATGEMIHVEHRSVACVDGEGFYVDPRLPEWHQIAHALGQLADVDEIPSQTYRPRRVDGEPFRELIYSNRTSYDWKTASEIMAEFGYWAFYDRWDASDTIVPEGAEEEITVFEIEAGDLAHDYLGIDSLDLGGD